MKQQITFNGDKLRKARKEKKWSRKALSLALYERGISLSDMTICNYENDKTTPDADHMLTIADVLGKPFSYFFTPELNRTGKVNG